MADAGGLILRGDDGSVYFIRDEVLEAAKVEGEELAKIQPLANGETEVEGFSLNFQPAQSIQPVGKFHSPQFETAVPNIRNLDKVASTVMCPW